MSMTDILLLRVSKGVDTAPAWLTQEHLEACAADRSMQAAWLPAVGDWYFCRDLYMVKQIASLDDYLSEGNPRTRLKSDLGKNTEGNKWLCDIYLPAP